MSRPQPIWHFQDERTGWAIVCLVRNGVPVFPVNPENKRPLVAWKRFQSEPPTKNDLEKWFEKFHFRFRAIGLATGPASGWVVVDVDDEQEKEWVEANFPPTPIKQHTKRGVHHFYRQGQRTIPTKKRIDGRNVDIRGSGGYIIIAPSLIEDHWRRFEIDGDVDLDAVPTLDDLEDFDRLMRVSSVRSGAGGTSFVVRDPETGLIIDGREGYLANLTFALCNEMGRATGQVPSEHHLARAVWDRVEATVDLSDDKWRFEHALEKATRLLDRIECGEIDFALPPAAPDLPEIPEFVSAEAGIDNLRTVLKEFLEYRAKEARPEQVRHLLIRSPAGLGKTTNTIGLAVPYILEQRKKLGPLDTTVGMSLGTTPYPDSEARMLFYVRTHNLAAEIKRVIEEEYDRQYRHTNAPVWRGRGHDAENGNAPCELWEQAQLLQSHGYSVTRNLCQRRNTETDEFVNCAHFDGCEYIATRRKFADFTIMMAAQLPYSGPTGLRNKSDPDNPLPPGESWFFRPTIDGRTFLIDETPIEYLMERREFPLAALDALPDLELAQHLRDGLGSPEGLLTYLRSVAVTPDQLRRCARRCEDAENEARIVIEPGSPSVTDIEGRLQGRKLHRVSAILDRLADEVSSGRGGESYSLRKVSDEKLCAQGRHRFPLAHMPGIVMDATADELVLRQFMPSLEVAADIRVERNAIVTQVSDQTFSRHTLVRSEAQDKRDEVRKYVEAFADSVHTRSEGGRTLVVTYKELRQFWTGVSDARLPPSTAIETDSPIDVAHFGAIRGLDQFKEHMAMVIIGRQEPSPQDVEGQARALWYDDPEPIQTIPAESRFPSREASVDVRGLGARSVGQVSYHPDRRVDALLRQSREAESLQAIDRLRLVHNDQQKVVLVLCKIPLPGLVVDRLLTWDELLAGGTKFERLLKACDERGICAVPLTPQWLNENHPDLWGTETAARRWFEARPQAANRDYTHWGAFYRFRLAGRGGHQQWAIIRNGTDDPRGALAASFGHDIVDLDPT